MKKILTLFTAAALLTAVLFLSGCNLTVDSVMNVIAPTPTPQIGADIVFSNENEEEIPPLEISYQEMDGSFCPFWAEKDGDALIASLTQLALRGVPSKEEPAEITTRENEDGSTTVTIRLKEGLLCSDGYVLDADDLIFTYYVLLDAEYDGPYRLKELPVRGLSSYWNELDMDMYSKYVFLYDEIYRGGKYDQELKDAVDKAKQAARDNGVSEKSLDNDADVIAAKKELDAYDTQRADEIRSAVEEAWRRDAGSIIEYILTHYSATMTIGTNYTIEDVQASEGLQVMLAMRERMLGELNAEDGTFTSISGSTWDMVNEFPTQEDFFNEMYAAYKGDAEQYWLIEGIGRPDMLAAVENDVVRRWAAEDKDWRGRITSISGIEKVDDNTVDITLEYSDEDILNTLTNIYVAPLHVYGNMELFNIKKDSFGFKKDDMRELRINSRIAIGAGEYVYRETDIRTVYLDPNENYWLGKSEIPYVVVSHE